MRAATVFLVAQALVGLDLGEYLAAVHLRQVEVEQDQARSGRVRVAAPAPQELHRGNPVGDDVQRVRDLVVLEGLLRHEHVAGVVLDEQDVQLLAGVRQDRIHSRAGGSPRFGRRPARS